MIVHKIWSSIITVIFFEKNFIRITAKERAVNDVVLNIVVIFY